MKLPVSILVATDLSTSSRHAAARAFLLAAETGAALTLTHVVSQGALDTLLKLFGAESVPVEQMLMGEARVALAKLETEFGEPRGVTAAIHLQAGVVLSAILEQADAMDARLLVVGARGESTLRPLLLGSTAERLLRRTLRPILVVKQAPQAAYKRVLVPVDFSPWSLSALKLAGLLAPQAELVLLHAFEAPFESRLQYAGVEEATLTHYRMVARQEAQLQLQALVKSAGLPAGTTHLSVQHGDASGVILSQAQEHDCDLIVMGKHGQGVMEELLLGSVTEYILAQAACDVLVAGNG
ncbi:MAG: universal stress protein [Gallionellaceae bacterium]|jgi:nucleotide-binding universal stress UspA family protein